MITSLNPVQKPETFKLSYNFSSREIAILARFFRDNQDKLPEGLETFTKSLEDSVYNSLSLEEARLFYS
jgi:hypothetical protein